MLRKITSLGWMKASPCLENLKALTGDASNLYPMNNRKHLALFTVRNYGSDAAKTIKSSSSENEKEKEKEKYDALMERQLKREIEGWSNATEEYINLLANMRDKKQAPYLPPIKALFLRWFQPFKDAILADRDGRQLQGFYHNFYELPADMMAVITMHKLISVLMSGPDKRTATLLEASLQIGEAIEQEAKIHRFFSNSGYPPTQELACLGKRVTLVMNMQKVHKIRRIATANDDSKPWGLDIQAKLGSKLIELLMETALVQAPFDKSYRGPPDIRPAFIHIRSFVSTDGTKGAKRFGVIQCDPLVWKVVEHSARHTLIPYMPMLVPPLDWIGYDKGAYFFLPSYVMRTTHGSIHQKAAVKRAPKDQLKTVFEALNALGNTRWRVNKKMLCIIERIWASGGGLADLVDREDIPIPQEPDTDDAAEIKKWKCMVYEVKKKNADRNAQCGCVELKLAVAREMMDEEGFYYPHNVDFRGRAYPMHPHLNHLGDDLCRGILEFAEGRPLRASGLRWIKIHIANMYAGGVDKLSHEGRIAFTENHLNDIFDSADQPLEGRRWWVNAEDPFQCLAACMNLTEALRSSSPEDYVSYLSVYQDGSCNGLQHYAALGRDKLGAKAVNLVSGDKPADVYSDIAKRVVEIMRRDSEKDPSIEPNAPHAKLLLDQVDRLLVKQTVMTSVYGVTYVGARDQIKKRLKERDVIADSELFAAANYAAKVTMSAQGEMFLAAWNIMNWLGNCAKVIASENQPVQWTTPLGLPIVQAYRHTKQHNIKTSLQYLTFLWDTDKILVGKQRTAFPPNFVHSLDSSHMMMTAIACKRLGLTFAAVHDSYWTHACDVDEMNRILREKFVELYEQPILENLLKSFQTSFPKLEFPSLPERGDFDVTNVLESRYFFN